VLVKSITREIVAEQTMSYEDELFKKLKVIRYELSIQENVPAYIIFSDVTLIELSTYLPQDFDELKQISGFGEIKLAKYGKLFLDHIVRYCKQKDLKSKIQFKKPKRQRKSRVGNSFGKPDTKVETFKLFKEGKSIADIVAVRELATSTIEGHLAHFILDGQVELKDLVPAEKVPAIEKAIMLHGDQALSPIKNELGDNFSYGEIRAVINHLQKEKLSA